MASRDSSGSGGSGFLSSDGVWVLVPLAALSIPIVAIAKDSAIVWFLGAIAIIAALTISARYLMSAHHRDRLDELAAQERIAQIERDRFVAVDRIIAKEGIPPVIHLDDPTHEVVRRTIDPG